jgi:PAS domain S-box-containing protein
VEVELSANVRRDASGITSEVYVFVHDISQHVRDLREERHFVACLRQQLFDLEGLFSSSPAAMCFADRSLRFIRVNPAMARLTGHALNDHIGRHPRDVIPGMAQQIEEIAGRSLRTGESLHHQEIEGVLLGEGQVEHPRIWRVNCHAVTNEGEGIIGVGLVIEDITEHRLIEIRRQEYQDRLNDARRLESLDALASGIAHDFNNLLVGILGNTELAMLEVPRDSLARNYLRQAQTAALRASELVQHLQNYTGKARCIPRRIDLNHAIQAMQSNLEVLVYDTGVLNCRLAHAVPAVEIDPNMLRLMMTNLVLNATEAMSEKRGVITISTGSIHVDRDYLAGSFLGDRAHQGLYAYVEVADTGRGIPPDIQSRLFDPFFTTKHSGRGLGLAAVIGIMRSHYGIVRVHSHPNKGAAFRLHFPAAQDVSHQPPQGLM